MSSFRFYQATLRHQGNDVARVPPFIIAVDLDKTVESEVQLTEWRLYRELVSAVGRAGCTDVPRFLGEYELQLRARGDRDVVETYVSNWRDLDRERRR